MQALISSLKNGRAFAIVLLLFSIRPLFYSLFLIPVLFCVLSLSLPRHPSGPKSRILFIYRSSASVYSTNSLYAPNVSAVNQNQVSTNQVGRDPSSQLFNAELVLVRLG